MLHWTEQAAAKDAALVEKDAELARVQDANARLWETLRQLRRAQFGRKSEKLDPDQLNLAMEETEQAIAEAGSTEETSNTTLKASPKKPRSVNRGKLPSHLPREEIVIEPESTACPCCGGAMHLMGEDRSERLDVTPAQFKVIVTRRPKYACRACEDAVVQAPAPARVIEAGIPTENLVAHVLDAYGASAAQQAKRDTGGRRHQSRCLDGGRLGGGLCGDAYTADRSHPPTSSPPNAYRDRVVHGGLKLICKRCSDLTFQF